MARFCQKNFQVKIFGLLLAYINILTRNFFGKIKPNILTWKIFRQNQAKYFDLKIFTTKSSQIFWLENFFGKSKPYILTSNKLLIYSNKFEIFCRPLMQGTSPRRPIAAHWQTPAQGHTQRTLRYRRRILRPRQGNFGAPLCDYHSLIYASNGDDCKFRKLKCEIVLVLPRNTNTGFYTSQEKMSVF